MVSLSILVTGREQNRAVGAYRSRAFLKQSIDYSPGTLTPLITIIHIVNRICC